MSSICWPCRLRLLAKSASRVPPRQPTHLSVSTPSQTPARARKLHASSKVQLPRTKTSSRSTEPAPARFTAEQHDVATRTPNEEGSVRRDYRDDQEHTQHGRRRRLSSEGKRKVDAAQHATNLEANVRLARQTFKDTLPKGLLDEDGMRVYERLYGPPSRIVSQEELQQERERLVREPEQGTRLLRPTEEGELKEVGTLFEKDAISLEEQDAESTYEQDEVLSEVLSPLEVDDQLLLEFSEALRQQAEGEESLTIHQRALLANVALRNAFDVRADELMQEEDTVVDEVAEEDEEDDPDFWPGDEQRVRTHPLTAMGRFCTSPTTIQLPKATFIDPVTKTIAPVTTRQMRQVAETVFDGPGLPYSTATPRRSRTMPQKPIPLQASNKHMNDMESYVYAATVMPGVYASTLSILTETRKRLGKSWLRGLMNQEDGPVMLDAGAGGAGVLAWRDILKAEWEAMQEEAADDNSQRPPPEQPPVGRATVLTASSSLRNRATQLLDDTSFIPRMPEAVKPDSHEQRKQYDLIVAPHILWPLEKDYMRKMEVDKLWSLLKPDGGVLVLLEKGVPRGFEVIAGARAHLLKRRIADVSTEPERVVDTDIYAKDEDNEPVSSADKEQGMIVAPCTNHGPCPMYKYAGTSQARKDWCYFSQRFIRPPFLQHIIGAKQVNHDDVEFSYVVFQRGRDLRQELNSIEHDDPRILGAMDNPMQDAKSNDRAFAGYESHPTTTHDQPLASGDDATSVSPSPAPSSIAQPLAPHSLSLPRLILPPLKRKKHVILDVCTPAATLERWTVTKGFSAQAYRDARKSSWGDLWALGAKFRSAKRVNLGKQVKMLEEMERRKAEGKEKSGKERGEVGNVEVGRWRKKEEKRKRRKEGRKKLDLLDL